MYLEGQKDRGVVHAHHWLSTAVGRPHVPWHIFTEGIRGQETKAATRKLALQLDISWFERSLVHGPWWHILQVSSVRLAWSAGSLGPAPDA